jgi:hypothetical protein
VTDQRVSAVLPMQVLAATDRSAFGVLNEKVFVAVFRGRCRTAHITAMRESLEAFAASGLKAERAVLVIIEYRATLGERGRAEVANMLSKASGRVAGWANVVEGQGFWASAFRGISLTVSKLARYDYPLKTFAVVGEAAEWLALRGLATEADVREAVDHLRQSVQ